VTATGLAEVLTQLRDALQQARLPLQIPSAETARRNITQISDQLDDYVLPRLANIEAPLLAVVGGSTGAGKSTLVNALVGRRVSSAGVIRPTTKSPVLVLNPGDRRWFETTRILPGLVRTWRESASAGKLRLVSEPSLPRGLALLDTPDIDSVVAENRALASQLLDAADLWLFVTSAARYSDAVPWEFLNAAEARQAVVAIVLDRVPTAALDVVPDDLGRLMQASGLGQAPLFVVPEAPVGQNDLLSDETVAPIRSWLASLAADAASRARVILQTLDGAIGAILKSAATVADAADEQEEVLAILANDAITPFVEAGHQVALQASDGSLLREEVLTRWHEYVGSTALGRLLDQGVSRWRDRLMSFFRGRSQSDELRVAAEAGLQTLVMAGAEAAAEQAFLAWQKQATGRALLAGREELRQASPGLAAAAELSIKSWQTDVLTLVAAEGVGKRRGARLAAALVNSAGAALMLVIFASTGGLTGTEIGIAGGTTILAQRLLEAIFGDEAVRRLAGTAKSSLVARIDGLMANEYSRYTAVLDGLAINVGIGAAIDQAVDQVVAEQAGGYEGSVGDEE